MWRNFNPTPRQVWSYTGAWVPAMLPTNGASFTKTFTAPGDYPYRITAASGPSGMFQQGGMITVLAVSNAPPVMLNAPVPGHYPPVVYDTVLEASPRDATNVAKIDFLLGTNVVGTATNFPYVVNSLRFEAGDWVVQARLTDRAGRQSLSPPVTISVDWGVWFYGLRRLPDGEMLLRYNAPPITWPNADFFGVFVLFDNAPSTAPAQSWGFVQGYGTLIDSMAPQAPVRFYLPGVPH